MAGESTAGRAGLLQPLEPSRRIPALDVVRGFALLGILVMNIEFFTRPLQGLALGFDPTLEGADYVAGWLVMAFVQGKFWTLFSLLFGMGFALMLERARALGGGFSAPYARRLLVLLLIGLAHALLLWAGDILVPYALCGFLLLLFRDTPLPRLWKWGLALYLVPPLLLWVMAAAVEAATLEPASAAPVLEELARGTTVFEAQYARAADAYAHGSFAEATAQRWADVRMQVSWLPTMVPSILGIFLLGAWLLRGGVMREPAAHRPLFRRLLLLGLPTGALLAVAAMPLLLAAKPTVPSVGLALGTTLMALASLLLCLAYLSALVLATLGPAAWLQRWLAPVGRMALSNYLLQSLFFSLFFYGYGLGQWGQVPRAWQLLLALAFFLLQVVASRWWMQHFRHGPVEWLWRGLTYLRAPPMRAPAHGSP